MALLGSEETLMAGDLPGTQGHSPADIGSSKANRPGSVVGGLDLWLEARLAQL